MLPKKVLYKATYCTCITFVSKGKIKIKENYLFALSCSLLFLALLVSEMALYRLACASLNLASFLVKARGESPLFLFTLKYESNPLNTALNVNAVATRFSYQI